MSLDVITKISGGGQTATTSSNDKLLKKITNVTVTYNKLWSSDTGRSISGQMSGSLLGIYPTITVEFGRLTDNQAQMLAKIVNAATQTISYYNADTKSINTNFKVYADDYVDKIVNAGTLRKRDKVTVNFIAWNKRT